MACGLLYFSMFVKKAPYFKRKFLSSILSENLKTKLRLNGKKPKQIATLTPAEIMVELDWLFLIKVISETISMG
jgi:hypothetical protein